MYVALVCVMDGWYSGVGFEDEDDKEDGAAKDESKDGKEEKTIKKEAVAVDRAAASKRTKTQIKNEKLLREVADRV